MTFANEWFLNENTYNTVINTYFTQNYNENTNIWTTWKWEKYTC